MEQAGHRQDEDQKKRGGAAVFSPELEILGDKGVTQVIDQVSRRRVPLRLCEKQR